MVQDRVADDETLYRRVPRHEGNFKLENGAYRISSAAFSDRRFQPSVDRAALRGNDPRNSQSNSTDCVVSLLASDVRYKTVGADWPLRQTLTCQVDVTPDPITNQPNLPDNLAHALIRAVPDLKLDEKALFRRLTKSLARLAKWEIKP